MAVNSYGNRLAAGGRSTCLAEGLFAQVVSLGGTGDGDAQVGACSLV